MKKLRLLRDLRFNPTGKKGHAVDGKCGDIVEVIAAFVSDMCTSGAATLDLDAPVKIEKEPEIKEGAPENKAEIIEAMQERVRLAKKSKSEKTRK